MMTPLPPVRMLQFVAIRFRDDVLWWWYLDEEDDEDDDEY